MLADRDRNAEAAHTALVEAEPLGTTNFYALYRLALVELPQNPDRAASTPAERRLQKAVDLNLYHPGAHALLANAIATGPAEGRARAVAVAQKAVTLAPRDFFTRASVARALWNAGQRDAATAQARAAAALATGDQERQQAQQMLDFFTKNAGAPR